MQAISFVCLNTVHAGNAIFLCIYIKIHHRVTVAYHGYSKFWMLKKKKIHTFVLVFLLLVDIRFFDMLICRKMFFDKRNEDDFSLCFC